MAFKGCRLSKGGAEIQRAVIAYLVTKVIRCVHQLVYEQRQQCCPFVLLIAVSPDAAFIAIKHGAA